MSYRDDLAFLNYDEETYYEELEKRGRLRQMGNTWASGNRANQRIYATNNMNNLKGSLGIIGGSAVGGIGGGVLGTALGRNDIATAIGSSGGSLAGGLMGYRAATGGRRGRIRSATKTSAKMRQRGEVSSQQQEALDRYNIAINTKGVGRKQKQNAWRGVRDQYGYTGTKRGMRDGDGDGQIGE